MLPEELKAICIELAVFSELNRKKRLSNVVAIFNTCHQWRRIIFGLPFSIDVESLSPNSLYWPTYFISLNRTIRAFSVRWIVFNGTQEKIFPACAILQDDPTYTKIQTQCKPSTDLRSKAMMKNLMSSLVRQRERLFQIDLSSDDCEMLDWENLVIGELGKLQILRIWLAPRQAPHSLQFTASSLTTLILRKCIPPSSKSWNLQTLVIHDLSRNDWDYLEVLHFLSTTPFLQHIAFDGDFYIPPEGSSTSRLLPTLRSLVSINLSYDFDVAISRRCQLFAIIRDLSTPNLNQIEWVEALTRGGKDEVDALPQQYLDNVRVIVISPKYSTVKWKRPGIIFCGAWPDITPIQSSRSLFIEGLHAVENLSTHIHCFPCVQVVHISTIDDVEENFKRYLAMVSKIPTIHRRVILYNCNTAHTYPTNVELRYEAWDIQL
ncbi:hypothetical protein CPB83DRAFT_841228 [Crepidotus variabilis]|uniref:Uncharacterized protein n=1 Tax=Crepidotus variabilis TaxID=179855 RepID=A0A9P6E2K0_9AGAR|nr:hypothetical protein CPB83DRAFT_841228 [Crepidotus variabilis]